MIRAWFSAEFLVNVKLIPAALAAIFVATISTAKADNGFYISGSAGAAFRESDSVLKIDRFPAHSGLPLRPLSTDQLQYDYSTGVALNLAVGYRFELGAWGAIRTEAELGYLSYDLDSLSVSGDDTAFYDHFSGAHAQRFSGTINAFYDLPVAGPVVPYVGFGLGGQHGENSTGTTTRTVPGQGQVLSARIPGSSGESGIWLAETGLSIAVSEHVSVVPAYRFIETFEREQPTHVLKIGVRYAF